MNDSEIQKIRNQFSAGKWPQLIDEIQIKGLRGWRGSNVKFNFPIIAIAGENGAGKSTLLKVAACAYEHPTDPKGKSYFPSTFFIKTRWDQVSGVEIKYRLKLGEATRYLRINKKTTRWSIPDARPKRHVFILDISRTLPLDASAGYANIARRSIAETSSSDLDDSMRLDLSYVLSRDYEKARFAKPDTDVNREVGILKLPYGEVSQFHQGAGEDTTLDTFRVLNNIPDHSLLIIDEVEASLHPKAQRRLVSVLLKLCRTKRLQVLLSTHSPYILEELPMEARLLLTPSPSGVNVIPAVSPEFAMAKIDDGNHSELYCFTEDREAEVLLREIIASHSAATDIIPRIQISPVGASNVVTTLGNLAQKRLLPYKSLAFLDGDSDAAPSCTLLPGNEAPERMVFTDLKAKSWATLAGRFGIGAGTLYAHLDDIILNPEHHNWTSVLGDKILKSRHYVWEIMVNEWCRECLSSTERERILEVVRSELDRVPSMTAATPLQTSFNLVP